MFMSFLSLIWLCLLLQWEGARLDWVVGAALTSQRHIVLCFSAFSLLLSKEAKLKQLLPDLSNTAVC